MGKGSVELQPSFPERPVEFCQEPTAEEAPEDLDREKEPGPAGPPGVSVWVQATGRDHTVDVGMMDERLAPGVEDGEEPETGPQMPGVGSHVLEGRGGGT